MGDTDSLPGRPASVWLDTTPATDYPPLDGDRRVDVAVVGGGIAGLSAAAELVEDREVAVVEADRVVTGVTGHTTAKLTAQHGLVYRHLVDRFGVERARRYADANQTAVEHVAATVAERDVDCDFQRRPAYVWAASPSDRRRVREEVLAAERVGLPATFVEDPPHPATGPAVRFSDQAQFHPREYLLALAEDVAEAGHVFEETEALDVEPGRPCRVRTRRGTVTADDVVVATHFPLDDPSLYFARMHPKRSYVLGVRVAGDPPEGMFYSTGDPFNSVRTHPTPDGPLVLVGGQNHKTGQGGRTGNRYRRLEQYARREFDVESVEYRWSTQDYVSVDRVPYVGRLGHDTPGVYVATGFGGWGMSNGTAAGRLLADLVRGADNPWRDLYDPLRFRPSASARDLVVENADVAGQFVGDWLTKPRAGDPADLRPGEARVLRRGTDVLAAYRDEAGETHVRSAVCTHMRCLVQWNDAEGTWDCPCHGSRFDVDGSVIDGPAVRDLPERDVE